jgi:hypothetical protein
MVTGCAVHRVIEEQTIHNGGRLYCLFALMPDWKVRYPFAMADVTDRNVSSGE